MQQSVFSTDGNPKFHLDERARKKGLQTASDYFLKKRSKSVVDLL
jgi:hypothetical protein